ncbi:MAG: STAS domain-containing protein [Planctomycetota bacterium]|jgi:anti-anti-sigma factor
MAIEHISEDVVLVRLPLREPGLGDEIKAVNDLINAGSNFNVILDFAGVELVVSTSITNLMILRDLVSGLGRQLILCNVSCLVKSIFQVCGLDAVFNFAADKYAALESLQDAEPSQASCVGESA